MVAVVRAHVAQSVEHLHGKEKVIGSIPIVGSICMPLHPLNAAPAGQPATPVIPSIRALNP
jgi:mevalonate pyrophosphate decarboxylase